jgi:hypothetical protein
VARVSAYRWEKNVLQEVCLKYDPAEKIL